MRLWLRQRLQGGGPWLAVMCFILLCGLTLGLAAPHTVDEETLARTRLIIGNYVQTLPEAGINPGPEFRRALLQNCLVLLGLGLCGLHILGLPLVLGLLFLKGLSLGYAIGFLIDYQGVSGFVIIFLSMLPQHLLLLPAFVAAAALAARFSLSRRRGGLGLSRAGNRYALRFAVLLGAAALAALVQGYVCPLLLRMFFVVI